MAGKDTSAERWSSRVDEDMFLVDLCMRRLDHARFARVYIETRELSEGRAGPVRCPTVVAALGAPGDGTVEILGLDVGDTGNLEFWVEFLAGLEVRGLSGVADVVVRERHHMFELALGAVFEDARLLVEDDESGRSSTSATSAPRPGPCSPTLATSESPSGPDSRHRLVPGPARAHAGTNGPRYERGVWRPDESLPN